MPDGGVLIDTPGLTVARPDGVGGRDRLDVFADIELLAESCRFRDCTHDHEPGCAVRPPPSRERCSRSVWPATRSCWPRRRRRAAKADGRLRAERDRKSKTISTAAKDYFKLTGGG